MCNCKKELEEKIKEKHGTDGSISIELFSGKTYSDLWYDEEYKYRGKAKTRRKSLSIIHSYCPFCGEKYPDK